MRFRSILFTSSSVIAAAALAVGGALTPAAAATSATSSTSAVTSTSTATTAAVSVQSLSTTAATTSVTVRGLRRTAQARWVDRVVDSRLASLDGCLSEQNGFRFKRGVYTTTVSTLCAGGPSQARRAASALVASRPWYRVSVTSKPVTAFTFTVDQETGNGDAVDAALRHLPRAGFTYVEGDDVSMVYVGEHVTQGQLDAARAAFAASFGLSPNAVAVAALRF